MLVAISGSQGSGKTTVLAKLKEQGFKVLDRKISRSILQDWNVTLDEVNSDYELGWKFQMEATHRKASDEMEAIKDPNQVYFTERSWADFYVFSLLNFGKYNEYAAQMQFYYLELLEMQQGYSMTYYLKAGHFSIERDNVRAHNLQYSTLVDVSMLEFTRRMTAVGCLNVIDTPVLDERVAMIAAQSRRLLR
jgi:predicted ATPase